VALKVGRGAEAPPFLVMDVIAAANARAASLPPGAFADGQGVIRMEVGQPGTGAPRGATEAAIRAMSAGAPLGYTEAFGLPSLRERIARHYAERYGVLVPASRIAVTVGASGAFPLAFLAAFDRGDRVALAAPYYPPYANILTALGMVPEPLPAGPESRYQPTVAALSALDPPPAGLILASPCNPAGTMIPPVEFAAIAAWCAGNGVRLISDEIYHGLTYGGVPETTAADLPGAVVINSFSKYFSMTGWRIGWMVLPEDLVRPVERLAQNLFISAPHVAQVAAEAAFGCVPELEENRARYRRNRDLLLRELPRAGLPPPAAADGAFYLWFDIGGLLAQGVAQDSLSFCSALLERAGIAATPGVDFDPARGGRFLRLSYCGPEAAIAAAPARIAAFLRRG
jgi:aspartate/methionine/tyrosine aminotransferase